MAYVYIHPRIWQDQQAQANASINPTTCAAVVQVAGPTMKAWAKALAETSFPYTRWSWAPKSAYPESLSYGSFFGCLYEGTSAPPPESRSFTLSSGRKGPKRKFKEWKDAQEKGIILASPLEVYAAVAVVHPGANASGSPVVVRFRRDQRGHPELKYAKSCTYWNGVIDGPSFPAPGMNIQGSLTSGLAELANLSVELDRYYVAPDPWVIPDEGTANVLWSHVHTTLRAVCVNQRVITQGVARANNTGFDVLTNLGELPKTLKWLWNTLKAIITLNRRTQKYFIELWELFVKDMRGNRWERRAFSKIDGVASAWMQYRYALMPLLYSIRDGLKALEQGPREFITSRSKDQTVVEFEAVGPWEFSTITVDQRCYVKRKYDMSLNLRATQNLIANIPQTAWELTKFSWMIDWAFNIGDFLASLQAPPGIKQEVVLYSDHVPKGTTVVATNRVTGERVELIVGYYNRRVLQPTDLHGLTANLRLNWKRMIDLAAVSWQQFRRVRR